MNFDATPTDDVLVSLYSSKDGTTFDTSPVWSQVMSSAIDPGRITVMVGELIHSRIGVKQTGSTDSHDVRAYLNSWDVTTT